MRALGLDFGTRRIGAALSDPMGWTAQPFETLAVTQDNAYMTRIKAICDTHGVEQIVIGLPLNMDGTEGRAAKRAQAFAKRVARVTGLPVATWDERLTSVAAERVLRSAQVHHTRRKEVVDQLSASLILQGWLQARSQ